MKHIPAHSSHKKKKKSPSSDSSSVSYEAGSVPKHSSRKKDKKIAGPKALVRNGSGREGLKGEDGERGLACCLKLPPLHCTLLNHRRIRFYQAHSATFE